MAAVAPQPLEVQREDAGATLLVEARVPKDLVFFDGHFPGRPVLPGFVQLHWVAELAREHLGVSLVCSRIEALRFREPLRPDDAFSLRIASGDGLRFAFRRGDRTVSEGRLLGGGEDAPPEHRPVPPRSGPGDADLPLRIPQQGAMRLLSRVLSHGAGTTVCRADLAPTTPLVCAGRAPVWLAFELLAQGMAAQGGLELGDALADRRAFVVGARRIALRTRGFHAGETLWVRTDHERGETGLVVCDGALGTGDPPASREQAAGRALARGRLTAFVAATP